MAENPFDIPPSNEDAVLLPDDGRCQHTWALEEHRMQTFGGVDVQRFKTCEECGEVQELPGETEADRA